MFIIIVMTTMTTVSTTALPTTHVCEKQDQDGFLIHATDLSNIFALPQFMAQHNCEDLKPIDTPSAFSAFTQPSSDHTSNQICAHNPMATRCNQSQYLTLLKQIYAHNPSASQVSKPTFPTL